MSQRSIPFQHLDLIGNRDEVVNLSMTSEQALVLWATLTNSALGGSFHESVFIADLIGQLSGLRKF